MNYCKVIFNKKDSNRVVGIHYVGPNAGEVMQGFSVAIKLGITMNQIRRAVGIHPTSAEEFTLLKVTKSSGEDYVKKGCWAWANWKESQPMKWYKSRFCNKNLKNELMSHKP